MISKEVMLHHFVFKKENSEPNDSSRTNRDKKGINEEAAAEDPGKSIK